MKSVFACALLLLTSLSPAALAFEKLFGEAYALDSGELLYHEHHSFQYANGELLSAQVEYKRPDGTLIGQKSLDFSQSQHVPAFRTELYDGRYLEGLRYEDGKIVMFSRKGHDAELKEKTIKPREAMAADAGFNTYVRSRFEELMRGDEVTFRFVAPNRLAAVKFDARKTGERTIEELPVVDFRVEISSFLSLFVDPLKLSYDPETRHLIEYRGLSNVRDEDGDLYKVRIIYPALIRKSGEPAQTPR